MGDFARLRSQRVQRISTSNQHSSGGAMGVEHNCSLLLVNGINLVDLLGHYEWAFNMVKARRAKNLNFLRSKIWNRFWASHCTQQLKLRENFLLLGLGISVSYVRLLFVSPICLLHLSLQTLCCTLVLHLHSFSSTVTYHIISHRKLGKCCIIAT